MLAFALLAAARTSAMELLKVRGMAPDDSELLKSCEFELFRGTGSCGLVWSLVAGAGAGTEGLSLSSFARLGVLGATGVTVRAALRWLVGVVMVLALSGATMLAEVLGELKEVEALEVRATRPR